MTTSPNVADLYSRFMAELFDEKEIIGVPTAFQQFFGKPENGSKTLFSTSSEVVDIDIIRGNEKVAAMVPRGINARFLGDTQKNTSSQYFTSFSRVFPLIEELGDISAAELNKRRAGENPYFNVDGMTQEQRLRAAGSDHHKEHIRRIVRLFEVLSAQSVLTGKMDAILGTSDTNMQYNFHRNSANTITVSTAWNDTSPDILGDIDGACDKVRENGHVRPDMMVLSGDGMSAFISDTTVAAQADNRRFELIEVSLNNPVPAKYMKFVDGGFNPRGRLRTPKGYELWLFTYIDGYTNSAGTFTKYMPDGTDSKALIAYSGARADRYFGPAERLPLTASEVAWYTERFGMSPIAPPMPANIANPGATIMSEMFYFDAYQGEGRKSVSCRTQAAPIFATTQTDAFATLGGIIT